jgi:acyl carrier protein phosphodiesterase
MPQNDQALLIRLKESGLDFVVIGGVCVVFHGVPQATFDLDVCCPFGEGNVRRIESAVTDLHPFHRLTTNKLPLEQSRSAFGDLKNLYLQTDLGRLDCLSEVSGVGDFEAVVKQSVVASFSYGEFRFLNLDALITSKNATGRERDLAAVRSLLAIKERTERQRPIT